MSWWLVDLPVIAAAAKTAPPSLRLSEFGGRLNPSEKGVPPPYKPERSCRSEVSALSPFLAQWAGRTRRATWTRDALAIQLRFTSSFRQILHLTVARKSLVNNQLQVVSGHVMQASPNDDRPPRRAVRQRVVPARWGSVCDIFIKLI